MLRSMITGTIASLLPSALGDHHDHDGASSTAVRDLYSHRRSRFAPGNLSPSFDSPYRRSEPMPFLRQGRSMIQSSTSHSESSLSRRFSATGHQTASSRTRSLSATSTPSLLPSQHPPPFPPPPLSHLGISPLRLLIDIFCATILCVPTLIGGIHPPPCWWLVRLLLPTAYPLAFGIGFGIPLWALERRNARVFSVFVDAMYYVHLLTIAVAAGRACFATPSVVQLMLMAVYCKGQSWGLEGLNRVRATVRVWDGKLRAAGIGHDKSGLAARRRNESWRETVMYKPVGTYM